LGGVLVNYYERTYKSLFKYLYGIIVIGSFVSEVSYEKKRLPFLVNNSSSIFAAATVPGILNTDFRPNIIPKWSNSLQAPLIYVSNNITDNLGKIIRQEYVKHKDFSNNITTGFQWKLTVLVQLFGF
jgi:hypothetical protein